MFSPVLWCRSNDPAGLSEPKKKKQNRANELASLRSDRCREAATDRPAGTCTHYCGCSQHRSTSSYSFRSATCKSLQSAAVSGFAPHSPLGPRATMRQKQKPAPRDAQAGATSTNQCGCGTDKNPTPSLNLCPFKRTASNEAACRDFPPVATENRHVIAALLM